VPEMFPMRSRIKHGAFDAGARGEQCDMTSRRATSTKSAPTPAKKSTVAPVPPRHERFMMRYAGVAGVLARAFAPNPLHSYVEVSDEYLTARYGPWRVQTPLSNIVEASISGPYALVKIAGPPRLSLVDRGLTFATNSQQGVCLRFRDPVAGIEPTGRFRHPGLTVTVDDPEGLLAAIAS
jgi:hypothetical protein